ncbi:uncharacterized protein EI90DRAFT_79049 [Cantharellus anzutake]|uniref:uncharacterized protein n=1 Tax=Cantharellus anzutake TaxID=1750568 RepID=UPI00190617E6|nr:uncharacterized protein EI90DRAFT_79049 [Cantharellus anzutake]KAF8336856.1 hypothetical protein EI90DRAFT_79049 [Cantharellus anzutake]
MSSTLQISEAIDTLNAHFSGCCSSTAKPLLLTYHPSARISQREGYNEALKTKASELSLLLAFREAMDQRIAHICVQMNDIRTACAGASALPVEILEHIFTIIAPPGMPHRSRFVMRIAQVSKRWRTIALSHKAFWTEFDFGSPIVGESELLGMFIKRARPLKLLTLVAHNPASLDVALRYSVVSSLRKLHLAFDASHVSNAVNHLLTHPFLARPTSLGLHIRGSDQLLVDIPNPGLHPSLEHITFTNCCGGWEMMTDQLCGTLETLAFIQCDLSPHFCLSLGYDRLKDLRLVRVAMADIPWLSEDEDLIVEFNCLQSLAIHSCSETFIDRFFRFTVFPALRSCRLIFPSTSLHFPSDSCHTRNIARSLKRSTELNHLFLAGTSAYILRMLRRVSDMWDVRPLNAGPCVSRIFPLGKLTVLHYRDHAVDEPTVLPLLPGALSSAVGRIGTRKLFHGFCCTLPCHNLSFTVGRSASNTPETGGSSCGCGIPPCWEVPWLSIHLQITLITPLPPKGTRYVLFVLRLRSLPFCFRYHS